MKYKFIAIIRYEYKLDYSLTFLMSKTEKELSEIIATYLVLKGA